MTKKVCGRKTEIWSRPCGYYRPFQTVNPDGTIGTTFNKGKLSELKDRKVFDVNKTKQEK